MTHQVKCFRKKIYFIKKFFSAMNLLYGICFIRKINLYVSLCNFVQINYIIIIFNNTDLSYLLKFKLKDVEISLSMLCLHNLTHSHLSVSFLKKGMNHFSMKVYQIWHIICCTTILTRNFNKIFLLKLSYKNSCVNIHAFSSRNISFFPQKQGDEKRKC